MTERKIEQVLRAHIRRIIKEDGGDFGGGGYDIGFGNIGGGSGMIWGYGIGDNLGKFLDPFKDVVQTAIGKTKELSVKAQTLTKVAWEALATTFIPFLSDDYGEIFEKEKQDMDRLKQEYAPIYQKTWDAFKNEDFLISAFFYAPEAMLTTVGLTQAPAATKTLLSILSGGRLDDVLGKIFKKFGKEPTNKSFDQGPKSPKDYYSNSYRESVIREVDEEPNSDKDLAKVLTNPKLISAALSGQYAQKMMNDGQVVINRTLKNAFDHVSSIYKAHSASDLERLTGKKLPENVMSALTKMQPQERQKAEALAVQNLKKITKESVIKDLTSKVALATKQGVPNTSPFIQAYVKTISKIKAL